MNGKNLDDQPGNLRSYFLLEWRSLLLVTASGLIYNVGLLAAPWFEGKLAQCLADILSGSAPRNTMLALTAAYLGTILFVQLARFIKRFYVRRFANNINRRMKGVLYANLLRSSRSELSCEGSGELLTRAISDVDDCAEGMRKFTTELFDTGVALLCYAGMLMAYDWRLAAICLLFPPFSYFFAGKMKVIVERTGSVYKKAASALSSATLDRAENAVTYRVYGCEETREKGYEAILTDYEHAAVRANIWQAVMPPLYLVLSDVGIIFILLFGIRNVSGTGWRTWDIAAFTAFLSCYAKLASKSSKAAKLFNALQKANVSWGRIQPMMRPGCPRCLPEAPKVRDLNVSNLSFAYSGAEPVFRNISFFAHPGEMIGVTGAVACGKSTLGRAFLCENAYEGSIKINGVELSRMQPGEIAAIIGYLGHDPELQSAGVEENVLCGSSADAAKYLDMVSLLEEVRSMKDGMQTMIGSGGTRLSGGQAQRLALARTLAHPRQILILDDPFSALDRKTEDAVFSALRQYAGDKIVILISHRLYHFPEMNRIVFMENGSAAVGTHEELMRTEASYRSLYASQTGGASFETQK